MFLDSIQSGLALQYLFKIAYVSSLSYIIYLMLNDNKPTYDPNVDIFRVECLLEASTGLAIFFPNIFTYTPTEVS